MPMSLHPAATTLPEFPPRQLSESVIEQDICGLVLSTNVRMNQHFVDATGVNRLVFAEEPRPTAKPVASRPFIEEVEQLTVGESSDLTSAEVAVADQINVDSVAASTEIPKSLLPEMLRVREYFER